MLLFADSGTLGGSALASWTPLQALLIAYLVVNVLLWRAGAPSGKGTGHDLLPLGFLPRTGRGLTRITGLPGWAGVAIGQGLFALLVAGVGFYDDVSWHIALGRDNELFTAPHTAILLGLLGILSAGVFGVVVATLDKADAGRKILGFQVPYSLIPMLALGLGAVTGFPTDEVWHETYGVDVTMWSPTHMLMILGASFVGLAAFLILAESRVLPGDNRRTKAMYGVCSWLLMQGLVASQGEFNFGVPQFNHLFHPVLISAAGALGLVAIRIVCGRYWAIGLSVATFALQFANSGDGGPVDTRFGGTFLVSALGIELLAATLGTDRRLRFAVASGTWVGTIGLAGEWVWNQDSFQPWATAMLPEAVVLSTVVAIGCAVLGAAIARSFAHVSGRGFSRLVVAGAMAVAIVPIIAMLDRDVGEVAYDLEVDDLGDGTAVLTMTLTPPDAADDAFWFQASAWQGGGLVLAEMVEQSPGVFVADRPVPIDGFWKTLVRLHRGTELMAAPVWFPNDPEIDEVEIPAVDRSGFFEPETDYLLRETFEGNNWLSVVIHGFLLLVCAAWLASFAYAIAKLGGGQAAPVETTEPSRDPQRV